MATRSGGKFDNALRQLFRDHPRELAEFLTGMSLDDSPLEYSQAELPGTTLRVDALIESATHRFHIEMQHRARPAELEPRLVHYWARLNEIDEPAIEQHVIVLDRLGGRLTGLYEHGGLTLRYTPHHLWDIPARKLIAHQSLFPLAILGDPNGDSLGDSHGDPVGDSHRPRRSDSRPREMILDRVIQKAKNRKMEMAEDEATRGSSYISQKTRETVELAAILASIYLPAETIFETIERHNMSDVLRELPLAQLYMSEGREEGLEQGLEQSRRESIQRIVGNLERRLGAVPEQTLTLLEGSALHPIDLSDLTRLASTYAELENQLLGSQNTPNG